MEDYLANTAHAKEIESGNSKMGRIGLGVKVKDRVTGLTGVTTIRSEHLNGCWRYTIQPPVDKEGKLPDAYWFDESNIEVLETKPVVEHHAVRTGGPIEKVTRT